MEGKLQQYLDKLFEEAPQTAKTVEMKEEMLQNLLDKYRDLLRSGKTEEEAVETAMSSIGDVRGLFRNLEVNSPQKILELEERRKKSAVITSISVIIYSLSIVPILLAAALDWDTTLALIVTLVLVSFPTGMLILDSMTKPHYKAEDDNVVEQFKEWQSENANKEIARKSIKSALWSVTVALYVIISFTTLRFHITWVIFLIGGAMSSLVNVWFAGKGK